MTPTLLPSAGLVILLAGSPAFAQPVAKWSFETPGERVDDSSGNGHAGRAIDCHWAPGHVGQALQLDGNGGVTVPHSPRFRGPQGFTVECWVRPADDAVPSLMNLITKQDEFMLRVDADAGGGTISFYVWCEGRGWEPRARGPRMQPGKWYHLIASWDGATIRFVVNRTMIQVAKAGECPSTDSPVLIGAPGAGLPGFRGLIDEVAVHDVPYGPINLSRMAYDAYDTVPDGGLEEASFTFEDGLDGWFAVGDAQLAHENGALTAALPDADAALVVKDLAVPAEANPFCSVRMAADSGATGVLAFIGERMVKHLAFPLVPDGEMHDYLVRCAARRPWNGRVQAIALLVPDARDTHVRVESIHLRPQANVPPDLRIMSLSPERRCLPLGQPATVQCWVRNHGGVADHVTLTLEADTGIQVEEPEQVVADLATDEQREVQWLISAAAPVDGLVRVRLQADGAEPAAMERPVSFSADPEAAAVALASAGAWMASGYPRSMDFRHLGPWGVAFFEHNTALLVDMIAGKIDAAKEFKRRYPDRLVLMQVNDELNGLWGSWHCIPREFAVKEGLECDPDVFPMPEFRGYWLLGPRTELDKGFDADAARITLPVVDVALYRQGEPRDVLIYRAVDGEPDWAYSEYASVVDIDDGAGAITLERWPEAVVGPWRSFTAGEAFVAPSVGSIYHLSEDGPWIKTWIPNLTKFCPVDPATGMDAATWWAEHFARLWHERIADEEPHPDGLEFDGLDEGRWGDCDNDGVIDGCQLDGVNYWDLGQYDFFRKLRDGDGFEGLGSALIAADASSVWNPSDMTLLNGSENEEFPSFQGPDQFPEGMDLYRTWCAEARPPACSYLQGRFQSDTYMEGDWATSQAQGKYHGDSLVRLSIASACMGLGIYTYRSGGSRDVGAVLHGAEVLEYPWDEYHAGREGRYNWLGAPTSEAIRMTEQLGPELLGAGEWSLEASGESLAVSGPSVATIGDRPGVEASVLTIDTRGQAPGHVTAAMGRAVLLSPETVGALEAGEEYALDCLLQADPRYDELEGERFAGVMRRVGFALQVGDRLGPAQRVLVGNEPRRVAITLTAPTTGQGRVALLLGGELGPVRIAGVQLRKGCAEVFARRFEGGIALANGSGTEPFTFDLAALGRGTAYRRFRGAQAPHVNTGRPAGDRVTIPPRDGLLLVAVP